MTTIDVHVPVTAGLVRISDLRDLLEVLDGLPENALLEVRADEIRYIESDES